MSRKSLDGEAGVHAAELRHHIKPVRMPSNLEDFFVQSPAKKLSQLVMGESRGGYPPLAEGLGDVPPGTKTPEGGREQGVLLFEIAT